MDQLEQFEQARELLELRRASVPDDAWVRTAVLHGMYAVGAGELGEREFQDLLDAASLPRRLAPHRRYSMRRMLELEGLLGDELETVLGHPLGRSQIRFGQETVSPYLESLAGRAMLALSRGDPALYLRAIPPAYRIHMSFGDRTLRRLSERHYSFEFTGCFLGPLYSMGAIIGSLQGHFGVNTTVNVRQDAPMSWTYDITWQDW